jgi:hypothetical protein
MQVLEFLAVCAFFDASTAAAAPPPTTPASSKKKAGSKSTPLAAALPEPLARVKAALQGGAAPLSPSTRSVCAQRLVAAVMHAPGGGAAPAKVDQPVTKKQKKVCTFCVHT